MAGPAGHASYPALRLSTSVRRCNVPFADVISFINIAQGSADEALGGCVDARNSTICIEYADPVLEIA